MEIGDILIEILKLVVPAVVGIVGYIIAAKKLPKSTEKKQYAEAADLVSDATIALLKPLKDQMEELRCELNGAKEEINRLKSFEQGVYILIAQLKGMGVKPDWQPLEDCEDNKNEKSTNTKPNPQVRRRKT